MSVGPSHTRSGSSSSIIHGRASCPILRLSFNQDVSYFAVGLETGFRVYSADPLREVLRRDYEDGGIAQVEMLYRTNLLALVGGGRSPQYALNKVILYDEKQGRPQAELEFRSNIKRVTLQSDRIIIVLLGKIHVFSLEGTPRQLEVYDTFENPNGICATSKAEDSCIMAFPALQMGHVCITGIGTTTSSATIIPAHESPLAALAVDPSGNLLATASEKGTLIRVFDIQSGRLLCELRRGADRAEIFSIQFNRDGTKLCVASDKGTIHIFALDSPSTSGGGAISFATEYAPVTEESQTNKHSSLFFMKDLLPKYFSSQWSFAQCRVSEQRCLAVFGQDPATIMVISVDGSFYRYRFDPIRGGDCIRESYVKFMQLAPEQE